MTSMLEGKALVVAIMMLTAAPLVVTDDGRAIVGDVTNDVTDMFTEEKSAEDPKRNEVLDDAVEEAKEKESKLDRKELTDIDKSDIKSDEKECYYLDEIKYEKDYDKEESWETEEELFAILEKLAADCDEGDEKSCEELSVLREKIGDNESEDRQEESEERSRSSGNESKDEEKEESDKKELDEELMSQMEELKTACEDGNEESCEELRIMLAELMDEKKVWDKEGKDWDEACLTMEEWKKVFEKDRKEKDGRHKEDRKEMTIENMMEMFADIDEEDITEIKQITNMSDEEWDLMIVKFETNNMTEEDWILVMEKMELVFEHQMKEERAEMEAFRAQMKEFDDACEAGNETACEELEAMMAEVEEEASEDKEESREDRDDREQCDDEEYEEDSGEEEDSNDESDEELE